MDSCTNQELGRWLPFYELDALTPEDELKFEEHLLVCPYCSNELVTALECNKLLRKNGPHLQANYRERGLGFDAEVRQFRREHAPALGSYRIGETKSRLRGWVTSRRLRWSLMPALVAAVAVLIFFVRPRETPRLSDSLSGLLPSHAIPYNENMVRGGTAADSALESIMGTYTSGNYGAVLPSLQHHVEMFRAHSQGWVYLGSTEYMLHDFDSAAKAFETAEQLASSSTLDPSVALYYGASLLQIGKVDSARVVLQRLQNQPNKAVARQAEAMLKQLARLDD